MAGIAPENPCLHRIIPACTLLHKPARQAGYAARNCGATASGMLRHCFVFCSQFLQHAPAQQRSRYEANPKHAAAVHGGRYPYLYLGKPQFFTCVKSVFSRSGGRLAKRFICRQTLFIHPKLFLMTPVSNRQPAALNAVPPSPAAHQWIDSYDLRQMLHISRGTLHNWCRKGLLAFSKVGGKVYFSTADVEEMMRNGRRKGG